MDSTWCSSIRPVAASAGSRTNRPEISRRPEATTRRRPRPGHVESDPRNRRQDHQSDQFAACGACGEGVWSSPSASRAFGTRNFSSLLNHLRPNVWTGLEVHLITANYITHRYPRVQGRLARHRAAAFITRRPTPAGATRSNASCGPITQQVIRRGPLRSIANSYSKSTTA
jgi:hypothetical protein